MKEEIGRKSGWASSPSGVWVPKAPHQDMNDAAAGGTGLACLPLVSSTYPAPPVARITSFLHITSGWLRGDHKPL